MDDPMMQGGGNLGVPVAEPDLESEVIADTGKPMKMPKGGEI